MSFSYKFTEKQKTLDMINTPVTDLRMLIGQKWFLGAKKLYKRSGVACETILKAASGKDIPIYEHKKLVRFLENYNGEY